MRVILPDDMYDELKATLIEGLEKGAMSKRAWLIQFNREIALMNRQGYEIIVDTQRMGRVYKAQDSDEDGMVTLLSHLEGFIRGSSQEVPLDRIEWVKVEASNEV